MQPPTATSAERAVISTLILAPEALERAGGLRPEHFADRALAAVWRAGLELQAGGRSIDTIALESQLGGDELVRRSGGVRGLLELAGGLDADPGGLATHAGLVMEAAGRRRMLDVARQLGAWATDTSRKPEVSIADATQALELCRPGGVATRSVREVLNAIQSEVQARAEGRDPPSGVSTGLRVLDQRLTFGGLPREQVTILAGATSAGKSALANTCMLGAALRGQTVLCCSLEDSAMATTKRLLSKLSGIQNRQMQRAIVGEGEERERFTSAVAKLSSASIDFVEHAPGDVAELCTTIRRHVREHGTDLVIVDFLQLLRTTRRVRTRQEGVDHIFGELVAMARKLSAATLVVSQLRRTDGGAPKKEDLYHSGALEQWSHTVALLWRPEVEGFDDCVSLLVAKQKNGPTGRVTLGWNADLVSYCDADTDRALGYAQVLKGLGG